MTDGLILIRFFDIFSLAINFEQSCSERKFTNQLRSNRQKTTGKTTKYLWRFFTQDWHASSNDFISSWEKISNANINVVVCNWAHFLQIETTMVIALIKQMVKWFIIPCKMWPKNMYTFEILVYVHWQQTSVLYWVMLKNATFSKKCKFQDLVNFGPFWVHWPNSETNFNSILNNSKTTFSGYCPICSFWPQFYLI